MKHMLFMADGNQYLMRMKHPASCPKLSPALLLYVRSEWTLLVASPSILR